MFTLEQRVSSESAVEQEQWKKETGAEHEAWPAT